MWTSPLRAYFVSAWITLVHTSTEGALATQQGSGGSGSGGTMARRSPSRYPARWRSLAGGSWLGSDRSAAAGLVTGWPRQRRPRRSGHLARPRRAPAALRSRIDAVVRVAGAGCERRGGEEPARGADAVG